MYKKYINFINESYALSSYAKATFTPTLFPAITRTLLPHHF